MTSPFQAVFLNSNLRELVLFLFHHAKRRLNLTIDDVDQFLARQRQYYAHQAISASLLDITLLNSNKGLLEYDPVDGVVKINQNTPEYMQASRQVDTGDYGYIKHDGCPFAKVKGASKNALIEVYEHFDKLALHVLSEIQEFRQLF